MTLGLTVIFMEGAIVAAGLQAVACGLILQVTERRRSVLPRCSVRPKTPDNFNHAHSNHHIRHNQQKLEKHVIAQNG